MWEMAQPAANPKVLQFGLYELDSDRRELRKSGVKIKLQEQPFQILEMLLERPGAIVTREELKKKLWAGDTFVDFDLSLNSAVKKLRQALNDDSENPRFIETLYRRGYRFIGPVVNGLTGPVINGQAVRGPTNGTASGLDENRALRVAASETVASRAEPSFFRQWRRMVVYTAIAILLVAGAVLAYWIYPSSGPRVLGFTQITHDGLSKFSLFTDGERIYFEELQGDHFVVSQVSVAGGETSNVPTPFVNVGIADIARDGWLLLGRFQGTGKGMQAWSLPLPSGPPHRLGDLVSNGMSWSPDGSQLVLSVGPDIYLAKGNGSEPRKLASVGSQVFDPRFTPDGRRLRFAVEDLRNGQSAIWEMTREGTDLHPLLPGWNPEPRECCGRWTPNGRYYLFQSVRDGRASIWALREKSWLRPEAKPVQLTNGPLDFLFPVASRDGKRIFAVGSQPRCELLRYDSKKGFVPYFEGKPASDLAFSTDGKWVAYVSIPERELWRSRVDGSERMQLTSDGMLAALPRWSPDGRQIVFMGASGKTGWRAYLMSSDGSGLRELIRGADVGYDPSWSPDGKSIALTLNVAGGGELIPDGPGIAIYDLTTQKTSPIPGAKQLFSPRWSPDGRHIAAVTNDSMKLVLFDRVTQQWQDLVRMPIGYPSWSHDGQYIYFDTTLTDDPNFFRIRISDRKLERLVSLNGVRQYWGDFGSWTGLTPDDSPLVIRDTSNQEIYALDWQEP
jgi:Tol biopolymer transport system component/DNA-binding winged helix-turn-helix (wHTH) protein